ncbi:MAG: alkaline phosphatase family protein [Armatimonadota bacterium]
MLTLSYIDPGTGYVLVGGLASLIALLASVFSVVLLRVTGLLGNLARAFRRIGRWVVVCIFAFLLLGIKSEDSFMIHLPHPVSGRVVILGMDGMTPDILEPLMRAGKLPHFAALQRQGGYRHLATTNPPQSPVAWTGFATGQNPGKHGLYDFIRRDPKTYKLTLATSNMQGSAFQPVVQAKRFWSYASEAGVESAILNCPITFPPDLIRGRMLSGMGVPDILGTEGTFTFYTSAPVDKTDVGGRVVSVPYATQLTTDLFGPQRPVGGGQVDHVRVPLLVMMDHESKTVQLEIQGGKRFTLAEGQWSDWQPVTFSLGMFKKIKGIMQFYLVETSPELKLYASPINFDPREPFFPIASPPGYAKELAEQVGLFATQGMPNDTWAVNEERMGYQPFLERVARNTDIRERMLDLELARVRQGIVFAYFDATDVVQHMCWRFTDPQSVGYTPDSPYQESITVTYQRMDALLGHVMQQLGPQDVLLVLSDHGFGPFRRAAHVNAWLRDHSYLTLRNSQTTGGELLADVDWSKTRAYAMGFGAIYLNQHGREAQGIVQPGKEADTLKAELIAKLSVWRDGRDGAAVISKVYNGETIFSGPYAAEAPDLFVGFQRGYRASWETALGAVPAQLLADNTKAWSGDHLFDPVLVPGILFANRPLAKAEPSMYDLAPTILHALGADDASLQQCDFDGEPLW